MGMMKPAGSETCQLDEVADVLTRDRLVVRDFVAAYGAAAGRYLRALQPGSTDDLSDAERSLGHLYDQLDNLLINRGRLYTRFRAHAPEDPEDPYHIDVRGLGGVYFVEAVEFGQTGYFTALQDAERWAVANWHENVTSAGRRYRGPFVPTGRDASRRVLKFLAPGATSKRVKLARSVKASLHSLRAQRLIDQIRQYGWPLTKAAFVKAMDYPDPTEFPLAAEIELMVPEELFGPMPTSEMDLSFPLRPPQPTPASPDDGRRLDESMVTSAALRHGLTYERAEQLLKDFGG